MREMNIRTVSVDNGKELAISVNSNYFYYTLDNLVLSNSSDISVNNGDMTTDQIIDKHLDKYAQVFDALS